MKPRLWTCLSKGRITQLLDPKEAFGERAASALAESPGTPPAYTTIEIDDPALRVFGRVIEWRQGGKP